MTTPSTGGDAPLEPQGPATGVAAVTAGSPRPKSESLAHYMRRMIAAGVTHFSLAAHVSQLTGDVNFYIHPSHVSGDTLDFVLSEDPFNEDFDFLYNKAAGWTEEETRAKAAEFLTYLRSQRGAEENGKAETRAP